jgi:uncharacterized protein
MHIIIDGYNLIRQSDSLRRCERQSLQAGRQALINNLINYQREKGHKITVVFDGWENGEVMEERDQQGNINIIYSRRGEKADEVIKRIANNSAEEIFVVSSDREIVSYVVRRGKTSLSSIEFEMLMHKSISESSNIHSYSPEDDDKNDRKSKKKGPARRLPRAERHAQTKIKKL